jgi:hypothetical protein
MELFSYNETKHHQLELRHIFFPSAYGFVTEVVIAVLSLIVFNVSQLNDRLFDKNFGTFDPFSLWSQILKQLLDNAGQHHIVQQAFLFGLWAVVGALIYILIFRLIQIFFGVKQSVGSGVRYVRTDHANGLLRWLASLHNFFLKMLVYILGALAIFTGAVICFGIASQELNNGLAATFPGNVGILLLSVIGAIISVRLIVLGISLLSRRFRDWYTT